KGGFSRGQKSRCEGNRLYAIEIDIGKATGNIPELHADVLRVAVKLARIVGTFLPFLAARLLGLGIDRHRLPSALVIGTRSFGDGRRFRFGFRLGLGLDYYIIILSLLCGLEPVLRRRFLLVAILGEDLAPDRLGRVIESGCRAVAVGLCARWSQALAPAPSTSVAVKLGNIVVVPDA